MTGKYQGAVGPRGLAYLEHFERLMTELGEPFQSVERNELAKVIGTHHYSRAVFTPGCYLMQPAALVRGLADSLPKNVELLEQSPIQGLQRDSKGQWLLQGADGQIRTPSLLLGASIFTQEFGYLRSRLLPVMTFASWTRPLTQAEMDAIGIQADWGFDPRRPCWHHCAHDSRPPPHHPQYLQTRTALWQKRQRLHAPGDPRRASQGSASSLPSAG